MSLAFFAIGDWGKNYDRFNIETTIESPQMRVANAMYKNMTNESFVVSIGDMFYTRKDKELNSVSNLQKEIKTETNQKKITKLKQDLKRIQQNINSNKPKSNTIDTKLNDPLQVQKLVQTLYEQIFLNYYARLNLDWYGVLGNHEYNYGDEYRECILKLNGSSTNPDGINSDVLDNIHLLFKENKNNNNNSFQISDITYSKLFGTTLIIFINTADLIRKFEEKKKKNEKKNEKEQIKVELFMSTLFAIIKECVDNYTCENIVIVGHHPIISHRHKDKKAGHDIIQHLFRCIVGLLKINKISPKLIGYICGHEHNYQVIDITCQGTTFKQIITGSGGEDTDPILNCKDQDNCHQIINSNINTIKGNNNYKSLYNSNVPSDFTYNVIDLQTGYGCAKIEIKGNELTSTFIEEEKPINNVNNLVTQFERLRPPDIGYN